LDWLTFVSSLIKSLSWPLIILAVALIFRRSIANAMPQLRKLKAGTTGLELEWDRRLEEAREELRETTIAKLDPPSEPEPQQHIDRPPAPPADQPRSTTPSQKSIDAISIDALQAVINSGEDFLDEMRQIAQISPAAAVLESYSRVESLLRLQIQRERGLEGALSLRELEYYARALQILHPPEVVAFRDLRVLRNVLAHDRDTTDEISEKRALEYVEVAARLYSTITLHARRDLHPPQPPKRSPSRR
jgi:hypothetical protein